MLKVDDIETTSSSLDGRSNGHAEQTTGLFLVWYRGLDKRSRLSRFVLPGPDNNIGILAPTPAALLQPAAGLFLACIRADDDEVGILPEIPGIRAAVIQALRKSTIGFLSW